MKTSVDTTIKEQAAIGERVKKLEDKDGDMWRTAVKCVFSALLGGLVVFILSKIGIS